MLHVIRCFFDISGGKMQLLKAEHKEKSYATKMSIMSTCGIALTYRRKP